jgi:hypothetical protein
MPKAPPFPRILARHRPDEPPVRLSPGKNAIAFARFICGPGVAKGVEVNVSGPALEQNLVRVEAVELVRGWQSAPVVLPHRVLTVEGRPLVVALEPEFEFGGQDLPNQAQAAARGFLSFAQAGGVAGVGRLEGNAPTPNVLDAIPGFRGLMGAEQAAQLTLRIILDGMAAGESQIHVALAPSQRREQPARTTVNVRVE